MRTLTPFLLLALLAPTAFSYKSGPILAAHREHVRPVGSVSFSPEGTTLLSASDDGIHTLWDIQTQKSRLTWRGSSEEMGAALFTPHGRGIISGGEEYAWALWDASSGKQIASVKGPDDGIRTIALSPNGESLATIAYDGEVRLWDVAKRRLQTTLQKGEKAKGLTAAFSPDGKKLFVGEYEYLIRIWDTKTGSLDITWQAHDNPAILAVAYFPDGEKAATGSRDNTVRIWNVKTGKQLQVWHGHKSHVRAIAVTPDGTTVISGSSDRTIKLWDAHTGKEKDSWLGHSGAVRTLAVSPDGTQLASGGEDHFVRLWSLKPEKAPRRSSLAGIYASENASISSRPGTHEERLGETLFFDPRLSGDSTLHCATCHIPDKAYTDGKPLSSGYPETLYFRNTPTLLNAAQQKLLYADGRFPGKDLMSLIRDHISEAHFMNSDGRLIVERLRQAPGYREAFQKTYGRSVSYADMLQALAEYVRSLRSGESAYTRFEEGDKKALSPEARRGFALFNGKANCRTCHAGRLFTDGKLHIRSVPENPLIYNEPLRRISLRRFYKMLGVEGYARMQKDIGLAAITKKAQDSGRFKTPSLLEASHTAPYMHNGIFRTLEEAIAFEGPHLSSAETRDIAAFIKSLSGKKKRYSSPKIPRYALLPAPKEQEKAPPSPQEPHTPRSHFPPLAPLPPVPIPPDNPLTQAKIELGTRLFNETLLSGNGEGYCVQCHLPFMGWSDNSPLSTGHTGTLHWRNSQTLFNAAYFDHLNWDGSALSLEEQARSAILSSISGNGDETMIEERLAEFPHYVDLFKKAFGVERPHFEGVLLALAAFQRAIPISRDVPFDRFLKGETKAISEEAARGFQLFKGKAGCIQCHHGALVSDQGFHATGVPRNSALEDTPLRQITLRFEHAARGVPEEIYRKARSDPGLYLTTLKKEDRGKFRTPSLRELKFTAPYMHNGVFPTLNAVLDFYEKGGGPSENKTRLLKPLSLTPQDKKDLIAFLLSLSMPTRSQ